MVKSRKLSKVSSFMFSTYVGKCFTLLVGIFKYFISRYNVLSKMFINAFVSKFLDNITGIKLFAKLLSLHYHMYVGYLCTLLNLLAGLFQHVAIGHVLANSNMTTTEMKQIQWTLSN